MMLLPIVCIRLNAHEALLAIEWNDGTSAEFASVWLRDNLPEDRDAYSGQRLIDVTQLPVQPRIRSATLSDAQVRIVWRDESRVSAFALDWLYRQAADLGERSTPGPDLVLFDNQRILHGRTGFASARHARHRRGCYLTRNSIYSETALLRRRSQSGVRQ
jgi:hypothetical protein